MTQRKGTSRTVTGESVYDPWPHPQHPEFRLWKQDAYDRLELRWRLRTLSPLTPIAWYGELGTLHRGLFYNAHSGRVRHIAVVRAYGEQAPDPADHVHPDWLSRHRQCSRLLIIGPSSALTQMIGALIAEAWGWQFIDARDLVGELTGEPAASPSATPPGLRQDPVPFTTPS